jgi:D-glycero-D-manno-heptose 1,7-bisphosphate phosphatase
MRKAVFLDRDGTINSDLGHYYIYKREDFVFNEGVIAGMRRLKENGFLLFVVTNQGGVAKEIYTSDDVESVNTYMLQVLEENNVHIEKVYYCPHHDSVSACECRKPSPYFINKAIEDFCLEKEYCFMIGDSKRDIESADRAGIKSFKIKANESIEEIVDLIIS